MRLVAQTHPVTGTAVHLDFPPSLWFAIQPVVLVQVNGGAGTVSWSLVKEQVSGAWVYTGLDLTFDAADVGRTYSVLVADQT